MIDQTKDIVIYAVGDVAPDRDDPDSIFQHVSGILKKGDISFCQLEITISDRGVPLPQARLAMKVDKKLAGAIKNAGFNLVSFASNHCMDWGRDAFFDTIDALKEQELSVIGAGKNIEEARKPAIIECKGTRIGFLAYNSILPQGYWAELDRPGCAPLRGFTFYEQIEHDQPGTPCRIHSFAHRGDLQAMVDDIKKLKSQVDVVILSLHWGIHFIPALIADYQKEIARTAIDSGADLILGHHAHILKGTEIYNNKVVFYSLCNFALDLSPKKEMLESPRHKEIQVLNLAWEPDPDYPTYYLPPDSRKTMIVKCVVSNKKISSVSFLPTCINKKSQPEIVARNDGRFDEVVKYMDDISRDQELETNYTIVGDEVLIKKG